MKLKCDKHGRNTMKISKRLLSLLLVFAVVMSMAGVLAGCSKENTGATESTTPTTSNETATYTVSVKTSGSSWRAISPALQIRLRAAGSILVAPMPRKFAST
jgi:hypothetical protein